MAKVYATPGVYIEEKSAFPNSAVPVATAVPAFIGYTQKAMAKKKDLTMKPTRLSSYGEFQMYFGEGPTTTYTVTDERADDPVKIFSLAPEKGRFLLHQSMKMFFANGGSDCYIVSVGNYDAEIDKEKLIEGLEPLLKEPEPTMVVIPDSVLLAERAACADVYKAMLKHCGMDMRNRVAILDMYDGFKPIDPTENVINNFREDVGGNHLQWGAAYYPWVDSTIIGANEINYKNISADSMDAFIGILQAESEIEANQGLIAPTRKELIDAEIAKMKDEEQDTKALHDTLLAVSPLYKTILSDLREKLNLIPPGGGMAGIYSMVDNTIGVWQSPANVSIGSVVKPSVNLTNDDQEDLNLPLNGKAINAIRTFPGKGPLIWGARTLDGNSQDWRYISVRRTVIFIEQSIKYAAEAYVFAPNTAATWTNLKALITNFLTNVWQQGALAGATAPDAFSVDVGLGTTMTPVDILDGIMKISVKIAVTRPAEFIVITFQQKMQQS